MTFTPQQAESVARRYPHAAAADGTILWDSSVSYQPASLRDALGWIAAGESDSDGSNPRTTRLARWWHRKGGSGVFGPTGRGMPGNAVREDCETCQRYGECVCLEC